ncbi:MAG: ribonuclease P protein component [Clostridia bacterium]|nr:ribonuclease P protein component [Clostridia bacterium]
MNYLRIKKNTDFQKLFNRGKRVFSPSLTLLYFPSAKMSMGIAVSKKHGKAFKRNRIKRLIRASFDNTCKTLNRNYSVIVLPRVAEEYSYSAFEQSFLSCFKKVNACAKN